MRYNPWLTKIDKHGGQISNHLKVKFLIRLIKDDFLRKVFPNRINDCCVQLDHRNYSSDNFNFIVIYDKILLDSCLISSLTS